MSDFKYQKKLKVVFVDWAYFCFRAIYSHLGGNNSTPAVYTCLTMLIGSLKRIGLNKEDKVILACEGGHTWRKKLFPEYKGDRKKLAPEVWEPFNNLIVTLKEATNFNILKVPHCEADDLIAYGMRYFSENECIIISSDKDYEQLLGLNGVSDCCEAKIKYDTGNPVCTECNKTCTKINNYRIKCFSPQAAKNKGAYKILDLNPLKELDKAWAGLAKKVEQERSDNLIGKVNKESDFLNRKLAVDLTTLPDFVEKAIKPKYEEMIRKEYHEEDIALLHYPKIIERFPQIYDSNNIVTYEKSRKRFINKLEEQKKKGKVKRAKKNIQLAI